MKVWLTAITSALLLSSGGAAAEYQARAVIKAVDRAVLSAELAARVEALPVRPGDTFVKGDPLVKLDCAIYEAQADKVSAEVRASKVKRDNSVELKALNSIGELEVVLAEAEYQQSLAEQRIAQLNTERCTLSAPWDGRVVGLQVNAHENVRQQQELIEIVRVDPLEAEIVVPAAWLSWLTIGQSLQLQADDLPQAVDAQIIAIIPAIDAVSQTVLLRAALASNTQLIPGMSATAAFSAPSTHTDVSSSAAMPTAQ